MKSRYRIRDYDFKLVILLIAITVVGIMAVGSASQDEQQKQLAGFILGLFLMLVISLFDYTIFLKFYWVFYILNIALLLAVRYMGSSANGARRWLNLFGVSFQPSETAKILLILFFAQFLMVHRTRLNTFKIIASTVVLLLPPWLLIYKQPDMSTSIIILVLFAAIVFTAGLSYKIIVGVVAVAVPGLIVFVTLILQEGQAIINDYQRTRILAWLQPENYVNTEGYQQSNSIIAIGSGQLWGKGLNNNVVSSVKNGNFISEPDTDFIFSVVGEEMGFIGSCAVIILLALIALECINVARKAKDLAGRLICSGMAVLIGTQSFMNIAVATGLFPNTGITLPFVSAGLTSLVALYIGMGFVLNVRLQGEKKKK